MTSEQCWTKLVASVCFYALTNKHDAKFTTAAAKIPHEEH